MSKTKGFGVTRCAHCKCSYRTPTDFLKDCFQSSDGLSYVDFHNCLIGSDESALHGSKNGKVVVNKDFNSENVLYKEESGGSEMGIQFEVGRDFEVISSYKDKGINLPYQSTQNAMGYDFESAEDIKIPSIWKRLFKNMFNKKSKGEQIFQPVLVPTGVKAFMGPNEGLLLLNRSGNPINLGLVLTNGVGGVDSDYHNSEKEEGHIYFQFVNFGLKAVHIKKGDRIGQGVFIQYLKTNTERNTGKVREGGHGHTGIKGK